MVNMVCGCVLNTRNSFYATGNTRYGARVNGTGYTYVVVHGSTIRNDGTVQMMFDVKSGSLCRFEAEGKRGFSRAAAAVDLAVGAGLFYAGTKSLDSNHCSNEDAFQANPACPGLGLLREVGAGMSALAVAILLRPAAWRESIWKWQDDRACPGEEHEGVQTVLYVSDAGTRELTRDYLLSINKNGYDLSVPLAEVFSATLHTHQGSLPLRKYFPDLGRAKDPPVLTVTQVLTEASKNHALDAHERGEMGVTINNHGKGDAFVIVSLAPQIAVPGVLIEAPKQVLRVPAGDKLALALPVTAGAELPDGQLTTTLAIHDVRGDADVRLPVTFRTRRERLPRVVFTGVVVDDKPRGQTRGNNNGKVNTGEEVLVGLSFVNVGEAPADDVVVNIDVIGTKAINLVEVFPPLGCRSLDVGTTLQVQALVSVSKRYDADGPLPLRYRFTAKPGVALEGLVPLSLAEEVPTPIYTPLPASDPEIERHCPRKSM